MSPGHRETISSKSCLDDLIGTDWRRLCDAMTAFLVLSKSLLQFMDVSTSNELLLSPATEPTEKIDRKQRESCKPILAQGHFCSNFFLPTRKKSDLGSFHSVSSSAVLWDAEDGVRFQCRRSGCKLSAGRASSRFSGPQLRGTSSPSSNHVSLEPHHRAVGASHNSMVARGHNHRRQGSGRHPDEKAAVARERASKLEAALRAVGDDDDTAPSLREALKKARQQAVPLSPQDKVAQCESFLERARKREAAARELVLQAQTELTRLSAEVVERGATVGDTSSRVRAHTVSSCCSRHVSRGGEVCVLVEQLLKEKEDGRHQTDPNPKRVCRREDFIPQCDEEMQEWIDLQAAIVAGRSQKW